jgi:hypothetical protein
MIIRPKLDAGTLLPFFDPLAPRLNRNLESQRHPFIVRPSTLRAPPPSISHSPVIHTYSATHTYSRAHTLTTHRSLMTSVRAPFLRLLLGRD